MEDDGNKQVEKHSGHIFRAVLVKVHWLALLIYKYGRNKEKSRTNGYKGNMGNKFGALI